MYQKLPLLLLTAALLSACGEDKPAQAPSTLACDNPAVVQTVRNNLQEVIKQEARAFARNDSRQFVEADKIIAAGSQLDVSLDNPQEVREGNKVSCSAGLNIQIPAEIMAAADGNSPLIYGNVSLGELLQQKIMGSNLSFSGNRFSTTVRYTPSADSVSFDDNTVATTAQTLSTALLPYGVKSILVIDGKAVTKEDAIKMARSDSYAEPPEADPEDILDNNAASRAEGVPAAAGLEKQAEVWRPDSGSAHEEAPSLAQSDLDNAREQNQRAESEINRVWNGMERTVQQGIVAEQRNWLQKKMQDCAQAAAAANSPAQAEYLQLQCDTRMTRERTQYLRGYTIN
ncbi:lysozyme inhibitor LprI family protein [Neisseria perflava]|uniref:lysozyme inhibitor LprI family protein n=1 Tax=Neisseria perflava TaxID=33053 RepID=UPI00209C8277|nr:lysozyme inhibitor LprI family protein [Neisseria perflava]MCP1660539.1 uncharacterized protein YecT (DUF1311 family) [Neisseria perflava]MCP1772689.1 uncharacterized protein YecT (DUF1311 family) [Neisseria perflava]